MILAVAAFLRQAVLDVVVRDVEPSVTAEIPAALWIGLTRPVVVDRAPYFTAFVASSCSNKARDTTTSMGMLISPRRTSLSNRS